MVEHSHRDSVTTLLHDAAELELGDRSLDHPGRIAPIPIESPRRHRRGVTALALVASIVLLAGVVGFLVTRSEPVSVQTPADGFPGATSSVVPGDSAKVVSDAVDATLATSWVGTLVDGVESGNGEVTLTYHPPERSSGRPHATVAAHFESGGAEIIGLSRTPQIVERCQPDRGEPCGPGAWIDHTDGLARSGQDAAETRADFDAEMIGLPGVQVASPSAGPLEPGVYAVRSNEGACSFDDCRGVIAIRNGLVAHLELTGPGVSYVWDYGSFGEAPEIEEPAPGDIVELGSTVVDTVCAVTIEVTPDADQAGVKSSVKQWVADNGRKSSMRLNEYAYSLDGVTNVVFSNDGGCEQDPVSVEVRVR